ncbi:MAG TPA: NAD(P)-dependent oxidoreductase [Acidimicrobiales bacterium]|nr:NAD(P)-dependent oxidoreductase [Acidimicrobiales bacterium]
MTPAVYPVGLIVAGRSCLVVGGGEAAAAKAVGLLECGATVTVVAPDPPLAPAEHLIIEPRPYRPGEAAGYWLVVAASADPELNAAVFADAEAARVWVNAPDQPDACSFLAPAVIRRHPIVVTAATGGQSPALAAWVARRVGDLIGDHLADLAGLAEALGRLRADLRGGGAQLTGADWSDLVARAAPLAEAGRLPEALELVEAWRRAHPG